MCIGNTEAKWSRDRPRRKQEDNIKVCKINVEVINWIKLAQYRAQLWVFMNTVMNSYGQ